MRIYEVIGHSFSDNLANTLRVMQGTSNDANTISAVSWAALNNMLQSQGYAQINQATMEQLRDEVDPDGSLIKDITPQGVILNTSASDDEDDQDLSQYTQGDTKHIDAMASHAASQSLKNTL